MNLKNDDGKTIFEQLTKDVHEDHHVNARDWFQEVTQEEAGTHRHPGEFCRMSKTKM